MQPIHAATTAATRHTLAVQFQAVWPFSQTQAGIAKNQTKKRHKTLHKKTLQQSGANGEQYTGSVINI